MIMVDPHDPAFANPAKFVGPVYPKEAADALAAEKGWAFRQDGASWRRVVPSPAPQRILEIVPITWLLELGAEAICAGGGGIPTMSSSSGPGALVGVEAVIDKDLASELLAEDVRADLLLMATDVDGVYLHWGQPEQRRLDQVTPEELAGYEFAAGSGPQSRGRNPFHGENRETSGDRLAGRHRRDRGRERGHQRGHARGGGVTSQAEVPASGLAPEASETRGTC